MKTEQLKEANNAKVRDKLIDTLNKSLKEQFDYVPLYKVLQIADDLLSSDLIKG